MRALQKHIEVPQESDLPLRWERALKFFRSRGGVIFSSYCSFWEPHAFVQQSLAKLLIEYQIKVHWMNGFQLPESRPHNVPLSPYLSVEPVYRYPGHRFWPVAKINNRLVAGELKHKMKLMGGSPLLWVQAGFEEAVIAQLPYVDIFSTFDGAHRHSPDGILANKSKLIVCQNSYSYELFAPRWPQKSVLSLPPIDVGDHVYSDWKEIPLPAQFPKRIMGYIGSFFPASFNLDLVEYFIERLPDWGFILMGRTDAAGEARLAAFSKNKNFLRLPWVSRSQTQEVWRRLDLSVLFYRCPKSQVGGFPTKVMDSLWFGVPCVGTLEPCTRDLAPYFKLNNDPPVILQDAVEMSEMSDAEISRIYTELYWKTNPKLHLIRVAEFLTGEKS